jgi:uncharacterized HhH-GPD family protein
MRITSDPAADHLLETDPFALLVGMLLDQQVTMESAFAGPAKIADRMGGLDPARVAQADAEEFAALCATPPAVHRFPGSMAARIQTLARVVVDEYGGDAARIWTDGDPDGPTVLRRLRALPGFGEQKAQIFLALLGKQWGATPSGWREAAGRYGPDGTYLSVADVVDAESLTRVREAKRAAKAAARAESRAPLGAGPKTPARRAGRG